MNAEKHFFITEDLTEIVWATKYHYFIKNRPESKFWVEDV